MVIDKILEKYNNRLDNIFNFELLLKDAFPYKLFAIFYKKSSLVFSFCDNKKHFQFFIKYYYNNNKIFITYSNYTPNNIKENLFSKYANNIKIRQLFSIFKNISSACQSKIDIKYYFGKNCKLIKSSGGKKVYKKTDKYIYIYDNDPFFSYLYYLNIFNFSNELFCPKLISQSNEKDFCIINGKFVFIVEEIHGMNICSLAKRGFLNKNAISDLAQKIFNFHTFSYKKIFPKDRAIKSLIVPEIKEYINKYCHVFAKGLCHFDLNFENIIFNKDKLAGILDIDNIDLGYIWEDLFQIAYEFIKVEKINEAKLFLEIYKKFNPKIKNDLVLWKNNLIEKVMQYETKNTHGFWMNKSDAMKDKNKVVVLKYLRAII